MNIWKKLKELRRLAFPTSAEIAADLVAEIKLSGILEQCTKNK